ncbi:MAG TPA: hypothetical protein VJ111_15830 [Chitinophagaceae bacterium]|nr:hypothetical protein [Chitinophagaceae bacterium]
MENLHHLIARLTGNYLAIAVDNHSFFVNNIPDNLPLENNSPGITSIINRILAIVTRNVRNACIQLSAKKHGHTTVLEIRESGPVNGYALASDLQHVNLLAEQMGGYLSISLPKSETTAIAFSFPDIPSVTA